MPNFMGGHLLGAKVYFQKMTRARKGHQKRVYLFHGFFFNFQCFLNIKIIIYEELQH